MDALADLLIDEGFAETPGGIWLDRDEAIGAFVGEVGIFVGWVDVTWPGPGHPELELQAVRHLTPQEATFALANELSRLRAAYAAASRECRYCGRLFSPGHMHEHDVCQGCAERQLGVVH